ncbi:ABC transporter substrate-binding protein [Chamaesiphon minutus]|uniref:ABC-type sugar transport system, periplasmic component n=1 Tax=Chamaesiphon minutus (strain ATCC 27169 / PCC 6605) TaxID=1173020 RepID=K9UHM9_CHAP6|nr:sugar ABC transporter substrate-binding protein [Chamaesiphon minutus]AFY94158.1 ABC-type sugar transport system, periplasmic component [Chamaesiphon minutus PCC 6605]
MVKIANFRRFPICFLLGLILTGVVSCFQSPKTPQLEFWTMQLQPKFNNYFKDAIGKFETANPGIKVHWVDVPWGAMQGKIQAAMGAKTAPDVVNLNPDFAIQLAARNAWLDLDSVLTKGENKQYVPSMWQAGTLNGKAFSLPWYLTTNVTIYNQQLFTKAGVTKPPSTYQELAQVAKQIKEKTGKYAFFTTFVPEDSNDVLESLVQMGVQLVDPQGKAAFNTPAGKAAFAYWVDLYRQGLLPKEALTQGHQQGIQLYQAGETAMLSAGAPFIDTIAKNAPQVAKVSSVAPQISGTNGKKGVAVMNLVIPRTTKTPDAAVKFALFITNASNQLAFAEASDTLPSNVTAVKEYINKLAASKDKSALDRGKSISAQQLAQSEILIPPLKNLDVLKKAIYEDLQAAMLGEKTVEQALSSAATTWDAAGK